MRIGPSGLMPKRKSFVDRRRASDKHESVSSLVKRWIDHDLSFLEDRDVDSQPPRVSRRAGDGSDDDGLVEEIQAMIVATEGLNLQTSLSSISLSPSLPAATQNPPTPTIVTITVQSPSITVTISPPLNIVPIDAPAAAPTTTAISSEPAVVVPVLPPAESSPGLVIPAPGATGPVSTYPITPMLPIPTAPVISPSPATSPPPTVTSPLDRLPGLAGLVAEQVASAAAQSSAAALVDGGNDSDGSGAVVVAVGVTGGLAAALLVITCLIMRCNRKGKGKDKGGEKNKAVV